MLTVERHQGPLDALAPEWPRLVDERHPGAGFRSFAWIGAWWRSQQHGRAPHVLTAREGGALCGILPLYSEPTPLGGRRLRLMADGVVGSDYQGALAAPGRAAEVARAFAAHLERLADPLELDDLDEGDPLVAAFATGRARIEPRHTCPHVRVAGDFAEYLRALPDGVGPQLARRRRWLERCAGYRIEELRTPDDVERGLDVLWALHRRRWALEGGSDALSLGDTRVEQFHRAAGRALAELGWARIYLMHVQGQPRAALYGFRHGDRFAFYQAGHEPEWRPRSVGTVLLGHVIAQCFAERLCEFDFLRGTEAYKLKWANGARRTVGVRVRGAGARAWLEGEGRALERGVRDVARRLLPDSALAWLRAMSRARRARGVA
jgi:CelD/BcsL family acetyltransferase involved in cellulose biosynthesis